MEAPWHPGTDRSPFYAVKWLSYAANMASGDLARRRGYDDALLRHSGGPRAGGPHLLGGLGGRRAAWRRRRWAWASCRRSPGRCCWRKRRPRLGLPAVEGVFPLARLLEADEVLALSTVKEVMPVAAVGEHALPRGEWCGRLAAAFREHRRRGDRVGGGRAPRRRRRHGRSVRARAPVTRQPAVTSCWGPGCRTRWAAWSPRWTRRWRGRCARWPAWPAAWAATGPIPNAPHACPPTGGRRWTPPWGARDGSRRSKWPGSAWRQEPSAALFEEVRSPLAPGALRPLDGGGHLPGVAVGAVRCGGPEGVRSTLRDGAGAAT